MPHVMNSRADLDMLRQKVAKGIMIVESVDKQAAVTEIKITVRLREVLSPLGFQGLGEQDFLWYADEVLNGSMNVHLADIDINIRYLMEATVEFVQLPSLPIQPFIRAAQQVTQMMALSSVLRPPDLSMDEPMKDLGLSIEPIVAFRDWKLRRADSGNIVLVSRNDIPWPRRKKMVAQCGGSVLSPHDVPYEGCGCGIYAFNKTAEGQKIWFKSSHEVVAGAFGTVNLWGEILIGPYGFRAEFAYPKEVFIRDNGTRRVKYVADELTEAYGIPVTVVGDPLTASMGDTLEELKGGES